jgi:hypothetical protein
LDKQKNWIAHTKFWKRARNTYMDFVGVLYICAQWRGFVGIQSERDLAVQPGKS